MGNQGSSLNLQHYFQQPQAPIPAEPTIRVINFQVPRNPYDPEAGDFKFHIGYDVDNIGVYTGHADSTRYSNVVILHTWKPRDHAIDFEVFHKADENVMYARGQHIGWIVDEDFHRAFKLSWDHPKSTIPTQRREVPIHPSQNATWERHEHDIRVLDNSLGLGNVALLIQHGQVVAELDDPQAHRPATETTVFLPGLDPDLNNFDQMVRTTMRKERKRDESPTREQSLN